MAKDNIILAELSAASKEQLEKNLENMRAEQAQYEKHKTHHERLVATNQQRLRLFEQLHAISDVKNQKLEPTYEFERDPSWVALQSQLLAINSAQERQGLRDEIERLDGVVKKTSEELARFAEAIPKIEAELAQRGD